jgi:hypothetical protein
VSHVRIGGDAKLTIEYGAYRVMAEDQRPAQSGFEQTATAKVQDRASVR